MEKLVPFYLPLLLDKAIGKPLDSYAIGKGIFNAKSILFLWLISFLFISTLLQAQLNHPSVIPIKDRDFTFGGEKTDQLSALLLTKEGGALLSGYSTSANKFDKSEHSRGGHDYWVVKIDEQGNKLWDKSYGGTKDDILSSAVETKEGYLLCGYTSSPIGGDKSEESRGEIDYWIVKIDLDGNKLWDKRFGGSGTDILRSVIQTTDAGFLLAGNSYSTQDGDKTQASQGVEDYWIVKIDSLGSKQWDKRYGGPQADFLSQIIEGSQNNYLLIGTSFSGIGGDKSQEGRGGWDFWIVNIDGNGNKLWDQRFGGSGSDLPAQAISTRDSTYVLAGISNSDQSGDKGEDSRGGWDYWVIKIDRDGTKLWDKRFGGFVNDNLHALLETREGNYVLGGSSDSGKGAEKSEENKGANDFWLVKINRGGEKLWDRSFGGEGDDQLLGVSQTLKGHFLLAGHSSSTSSHDKSQPSRGGYDYWLVKTTLDGEVTPSLLVSFGSKARKVPQGWVKDYGLAFGEKQLAGRVWKYGWKNRSDGKPIDLSVGGPFPGNGRSRPAPSDSLLAGLMHMQGNHVKNFRGTPIESYWEIALANGEYQVTISVGDGAVYTGTDRESHSIQIEGKSAILHFIPKGVTGSLSRFQQATLPVRVNDGLLTLDADGGTNTKINYVIIQPMQVSTIAVLPEMQKEITNRPVKISPNPFTAQLRIETQLAGKVRVDLLDGMGHTFYTTFYEADRGYIHLDMSGLKLKAGLYFIRLQTADGRSQIGRVIKQ